MSKTRGEGGLPRPVTEGAPGRDASFAGVLSFVFRACLTQDLSLADGAA